MTDLSALLSATTEIGPFDVVVADPAWMFGDKLPGAGRGAEKHYGVMTTRGICDMASIVHRTATPIALTMSGQRALIAEDAHLFLWRVSAMQQEALDVVRAWGFTVKSELVWLKRTKKDKEHFGMGRHVRMSHEVCLICTRGRGAGIVNRSQRSTFTTDLDEDGGGEFEAQVGRHSKKPDRFYEIVEGLFAPSVRRLELFARRARPGWTVLGDEAPGTPGALTR